MITILNSYVDDFIPHWHNRLERVQNHVFVFVTEGSLSYRLNDNLLHAAKGDLLFIPSGTHRESYNDPTVLHQKYAVTFLVDPEHKLPLWEHKSPVQWRTRSFEYFKERFIALHRQSLEHRPFYETIRSGILLEMLGTASREFTEPTLPLRKALQVSKLEQYILQHLRETITLKEMGALINRSPNYTLVLFKEAAGETPLEYQHRLRITAAKEMLQNTRFTIAEIAEHLGYYDSSYFYKTFRKITGLSPTDFVKKAHLTTR